MKTVFRPFFCATAKFLKKGHKARTPLYSTKGDSLGHWGSNSWGGGGGGDGGLSAKLHSPKKNQLLTVFDEKQPKENSKN